MTTLLPLSLYPLPLSIYSPRSCQISGVAWLSLRQQASAFVPAALIIAPSLSSTWAPCTPTVRLMSLLLDNTRSSPRRSLGNRIDGALFPFNPGSSYHRTVSRPCSFRRRGQRGSQSKLHMSMPFDPGFVTTTLLAGGGDVSAWSVTSLTSDLGAELFQASLIPYLAFLFFLSRKETKAPEGAFFGFAFLLVFVVATIPAGILGTSQTANWKHDRCINLMPELQLIFLTVLLFHMMRSRLPKELAYHERLRRVCHIKHPDP